MRDTPLVTVVIPTFNRACTIERAINSVLLQTYSNVDIVVVDDCSTDDTADVIRAMNLSNLIYVRNEKNLKGGMSRNIGVDVSKGELIAFLDSDDEWLPNKLAAQVQTILASEKPDEAICYSALLMKEDDPFSKWPDRGQAIGETVADYLFVYGGYMQTSSLVASARLLKQHPFDVSLKKHQDWDLVLRLESAGCEFLFVDQPLVVWHQDGGERVSDLVNLRHSQNWIANFEGKISRSAFWGFKVRILVPELAKQSLSSRGQGLWILTMALRRRSIGLRQLLFETVRMSSPVACRRKLKALFK